MGKIYSHLKVMNKVILKNRLSEDVDCVSFFHDNKKFEIFFTRKRANKYSMIYCVGNTIEWEQVPMLPRIAGSFYGERKPIISFSTDRDSVRIFVIRGKPNCIIGLDDGMFRSISKYDEKYINVMSEGRFKEL